VIAINNDDPSQGLFILILIASAVLGNLVVLSVTLSMSAEQVEAWGWRIPFFVALPLGLIGLYLRNKLEDTPEFRRMEAQGEIRGGRFVSGFVGEQFARPEAVELLREIRRDQNVGDAPNVSAADPLNLGGIITPGPRVSPLSGLVVPLWQDAEPDVYRDDAAVGDKMRSRSDFLHAHN